jgi:hypothetical protein
MGPRFREDDVEAALRHTKHRETVVQPHWAPSLSCGGLVMDSTMPSEFEIGDRVDQTHSNHVEGTVVAVFTNKAGERRYAVEMFGHRTIQVVSAGSLVAHGNWPR